jgi:pilus assembly protein CpaE
VLKAVVICPDQELSARLQEAVAETRSTVIVRTLDRYPNMVDLVRFLRASAPDVVFLSMESREQAMELAVRIEANAAGTQIVAVNRICDPSALLENMHAGIREFFAPPFDTRQMLDALLRVEERVHRKPPNIGATDCVYSFLPSKAGVGCSTIALNVSVLLSEQPETNVLLADFDLNCGMIGFMLQVEGPYSVITAAENSLDMDESLWPKMVCSRGNMDVLPSGKITPGFRIEPAQIRELIAFARRHYKTICMDLSGMMEKYSIEILHESKRVFLVCTPEIPSLHLAREKLNFLKSINLDSRVTILLNRAQKRHVLSLKEIEKIFGLPVHCTFPNDYMGVHHAMTAGKHVDPASDLGRQFRKLADSISGPLAQPHERKTGLLRLFLPGKVRQTSPA